MNGTNGEEEHECSQKVTLNTICIKLENIEKSIAKIEEFQTTFAQEISQIRLNSAKYPTPEVVSETLTKVNRHDTYFTLIGAGLITAWGFLLWLWEQTRKVG